MVAAMAGSEVVAATAQPQPHASAATKECCTSVCEAALEGLHGSGDVFPGELRELPEGYGADGMCPHHRYLPADYGEADLRPRTGRSDTLPGEGAVAGSVDFGHATSWSVGDVQKQMPKPERMKDLVRYKGPAAQKGVLKQAATNAELQRAIESGDSDLVAAILKYGLAKRCVNVNAVLFPKRERMLHLAARRNFRDICVMLLEAKAELDPEEITDGRQPLHDACAHGAYDAAELLLDRRARLEECTFTGMRPLHWAVAGGHADVADLLLDRGANISTASSNTWEPLHHAAHGGHDKVVRLLCRRGARLDAKTHAGQRPVQLACHGGHIKAAAALMDFGATGVLEDLGEQGALLKWRDTPLEELMRCVERLRFQRDEGEELHDAGDSDGALDMFRCVVEGYTELGLLVSARAAHADGVQLGLALPPLDDP